MTDSCSQKPLILIVDDEEEIRLSLVKIFKKEGFEVFEAADGEIALKVAADVKPAVVLTDMVMPNLSGLQLIRALHSANPETEVVLMTAYGTVDSAVEAMRGGAYDFITKPLKRLEVVKIIKQALEHHNLLMENRQLKEHIARQKASGYVFSSPAIKRVMNVVEQVAPTDVTVLLTGESGTGKEVIARILHENSSCASGPFVAVNCAALPETILESELFGHEKGAFTGAHERHEGRFERAHGGTLFLDEIGEMSPALQVRLLRVLQDGTFERVGGTKPITVSVRIIAATNANLIKEVEEGRFREDLFYRLNVVALHLPPLRERIEDIVPLSYHFADLYSKRHHHEITGISDKAIMLLEKYSWPGNVRQLENIIERAVVLTANGIISATDLPQELQEQLPALALERADDNVDGISISWGSTIDQVKDLMINEALRRCNGDKTKAAKILGITTRSIYRHLGGQQAEEE